MSTSSDILNDVDLRYRNTFTVDQKLVWFNEEQRELFDVLELDSEPYGFVTVADNNYYPFPDQFDTSKIKSVAIQIDSNLPEPPFVEVPFRRNSFDVDGGWSYWYTIVSNMLYLYYAGGVPDGKTVYIYCESDPTEVTDANLTSSPDLPVKYQEILKLGILKRIAQADQDVVMSNDFDNNYQEKIAEILWSRKLKEPEWTQPTDELPRVNGYRFYGWSPTSVRW